MKLNLVTESFATNLDKTTLPDSPQSPAQASTTIDPTPLDKQGLAARYLVGVRTIEDWIVMAILPHQRIGRKHRFHPEACDNALACWTSERMTFGSPRLSTHVPQTNPAGRASLPAKQERSIMLASVSAQARRFATKAMLAARYAVSLRTITNWVAQGILTPIRIRRVVRFDMDASDQSLREHGYWN